MNTAVMFGKATDEWATPQECFDALNAEFKFTLDAAATAENRKCLFYLGPDMPAPYNDGLTTDWWLGRAPDTEAAFCNPPYSKCRQFIAKAAVEAKKGLTCVCLVPARTCTKWWHEHVWDAEKHQPRAGVEIRFIKGRLKFGEGKNSAPFPSVVIIFRGRA
jgi:phage N-6-adenine-methyltransferase